MISYSKSLVLFVCFFDLSWVVLLTTTLNLYINGHLDSDGLPIVPDVISSITDFRDCLIKIFTLLSPLTCTFHFIRVNDGIYVIDVQFVIIKFSLLFLPSLFTINWFTSILNWVNIIGFSIMYSIVIFLGNLVFVFGWIYSFLYGFVSRLYVCFVILSVIRCMSSRFFHLMIYIYQRIYKIFTFLFGILIFFFSKVDFLTHPIFSVLILVLRRHLTEVLRCIKTVC